MRPPPAPTLRSRRREATRHQVYEAALVVFRRDGVAGARIEDIARAAGVSRGTFYFHFPTKDDVLAERLLISERKLVALLAELPPTTHLATVLERLATAMAAEWQADPKIFAEVGLVSVRRSAAGPGDHAAHPVRAALAEQFQRAVARGQLSDALPGAVLCDIFLTNLFAAALAWSAAPLLPLRTVLEKVVALFLHGVAG